VEKPQETQSARPSGPERPGRRPLTVAVRIVLIVAIVLAMVVLVDALRHPGGSGSEETAGLGAREPVRLADGDAPAAPRPAPAGDFPPQADRGLRRMLAGVLMAAVGDEDGDLARDPDPTEAQERVADLFALPYDFPRSEAAPDLLPPQATVLMVIERPSRRGGRMALVRMPGTIDVALEALNRHYDERGWEFQPLENPRTRPETQPDRGWLVHYRKVRQGRVVARRVVYARQRSESEETLVAVYDPDDEGT